MKPKDTVKMLSNSFTDFLSTSHKVHHLSDLFNKETNIVIAPDHLGGLIIKMKVTLYAKALSELTMVVQSLRLVATSFVSPTCYIS
jgi:hypothetical protein